MNGRKDQNMEELQDWNLFLSKDLYDWLFIFLLTYCPQRNCALFFPAYSLLSHNTSK
jgi:hypothetical protein